MYSLARQFLFRLDAEQAHGLGLQAIAAAYRSGMNPLLASKPAPLKTRAFGIEFPNPVGCAAGLDKNGAYVDALLGLGFGFVEIGTTTPRPQAGNPKPRMFRIPEQQAVINRLGFNNAGVDALVRNVEKARRNGILGINIGKNFDTPNERAADDYLACLRVVYPHAAYVAVNISSPNTRGLRDLQSEAALGALLAQLKREQIALAQRHGRHVPLAVKIAPDLTDEAVRGVARLLVEHHLEGVIATNTTIARDAVAGLRHADETGGLSGAPVRERSNAVIRVLAAALDGALPIIGVGGILSGDDARAKIAAGASLVQLYTGLIYRGPALVAECVKALARP